MITRFAPSPTGPLHLGHAYSALLGHDMARQAGGEWLLRIEDIDQDRCRPQWETQINDDLRWLGLTWSVPVMRQSARFAAYDQALAQLWAMGLLYPCSCRRRDIAVAAQAPQAAGAAPARGPDGVIYPGTCRNKPRPDHFPQGGAALRLDLAQALTHIAGPLHFEETGGNPGLHRIDPTILPASVGDVVLARRAMGVSYHLAVVIDDAAQSVSCVVRGIDLQPVTTIHVVLQRLLGLSTPMYHHHRLICDKTGKRLAKRDDARAIAAYRAKGKRPDDIRQMVGL